MLQRWRDEAVKAGRTITRIAVAFEASRDGFWLARWLRARGVEAFVIHSTTVAVPREHRRAKTDRLDTELLKRADPNARSGGRQTSKPRAREPGRSTDPYRQSDEGMLFRRGRPNFKPTLRQSPERQPGSLMALDHNELTVPSSRSTTTPRQNISKNRGSGSSTWRTCPIERCRLFDDGYSHVVRVILMSEMLSTDLDLNRPPTDEDFLRLQFTTLLYYLHCSNPDNGLVRDKTQANAPASIAAIGMALASIPVVVERVTLGA